jgi:hypothetical protein
VPVNKPNYVSVMNRLYQNNGGILVAEHPGLADPKICESDADCGPAGSCNNTEACTARVFASGRTTPIAGST